MLCDGVRTCHSSDGKTSSIESVQQERIANVRWCEWGTVPIRVVPQGSQVAVGGQLNRQYPQDVVDLWSWQTKINCVYQFITIDLCIKKYFRFHVSSCTTGLPCAEEVCVSKAPIGQGVATDPRGKLSGEADYSRQTHQRYVYIYIYTYKHLYILICIRIYLYINIYR